METIKNAIKSALERGDARDRGFREKVYRQAFAALDRSLQARSDLTAEDTQRRRDQVKAAIVDIERGYLEGRTAPQPAEPAVPRQPAPAVEPVASSAESISMPRIERGDRIDIPNGSHDRSYRAEKQSAQLLEGKKRRGTFVGPLIIGVIAVAGIGAWLAFGGSLPSPVEQNVGAPGQSSTDQEWITVFSPDNPTSVRAPAGTSAEVMTGEEDGFLRITAEAADAAVSFDVGQGILERIAGNRATFSLAARSEEDQETQISISCDFGALGNCGRSRYVVGASRTEYLFEVELSDQQPSGGGTIAIRPDVEGQGRALDVFSLRVTATD